MSTGRHGKVQKISIGQFAQKELAIYGSPCSDIQALLGLFQKKLDPLALAFVDESHDDTPLEGPMRMTKHGEGAALHLSHYSPLERQSTLRQADLTLINGNHFAAQAQLIVYDSAKEKSLLKRKEELNHVLAFVGTRDQVESLMHQGLDLDSAPIFEHLEDPNFWTYLRDWIGSAPLSALVLTGGKSLRMGKDKSMMVHHALPQYLHLQNACKSLNLHAVLSCRSEQKQQYQWSEADIIEDQIQDIGSIAGLISAWMRFPDRAWLSMACDMPRLSTRSMQQLLSERQAHRVATTVCLNAQSGPEPMLTIWEPRAYPIVLQALSLGITCPRKILMGSNVHSVIASFPEELHNANTPQDLETLRHE